MKAEKKRVNQTHNSILKNGQQMKTGKHSRHLYSDICRLIEEARVFVAHAANKTMTLLYWQVGNRINNELLDGKRAEYGKQYGKRGFQERNIRRMIQFAIYFPDFEIVSQAATQLRGSHFIELPSLNEEIKRDFYLTMTLNIKWGRDTLRSKIDGMFRTF